MEEKKFITAKTYDELANKVRKIENEELPAVAKEIDEARKHGDLRENAQYAAAKEKQRMIQSKLQEINQALTSHVVIDIASQQFDTVCFGSQVVVNFLDDNTTKTFIFLSDFDSNVSAGIMSVNAPIAQALFGLSVGDIAEITLAGKTREIEIKQIQQAQL